MSNHDDFDKDFLNSDEEAPKPNRIPLTDNQQEFLNHYSDCQNISEAARRMDVTRQSAQGYYRAIVSKGWATWLTPTAVPDDKFELQKTTVQYDKFGRPIQEWKRLVPRATCLNDVVEGLCEKVKGMARVPVRKERKTDCTDILFEIDLYDAHVGLYADEKETRDENYTTEIAAKRMIETTEGLCRRAGRPQKVVVVFGGDMLHSDNRSNQTEQSKNVLDVDTRYHRVVKYIIGASREVIQLAASIGAEVEVVVLEGNHSWHSEVWLAQVLKAYYHDCPNVTVRIDPNPRKWMIWGDNLLVWSHGDKISATKWSQIIAAELAVQWGQTRNRYLKCGHIHHQKEFAPIIVNEQSGLVIEYLPALCATDAYHTGAGYVGNMKGATAYEIHKKLGAITKFFQPINV